MIVIAVLAVPMAVLWVLVSSSVSLGSLLVGYGLGFAILYVLNVCDMELSLRKLPSQTVALIIYTATLMRDIWLSSVDVAKRVLDPTLPLNPGVIAVPTQDETECDFTAAFSAHGITITPGELVLDFDGSHTMYVHCLDVEASGKNAPGAQTKRLALLNRIKGK